MGCGLECCQIERNDRRQAAFLQLNFASLFVGVRLTADLVVAAASGCAVGLGHSSGGARTQRPEDTWDDQAIPLNKFAPTGISTLARKVRI